MDSISDDYGGGSSSSGHAGDESTFAYLVRELAEKATKTKEAAPIDYSVLSVAIMTLGLLLFVEIVRHYIDHKAHGRPYFQTVLDGVYSECECSVFVAGGDCSGTGAFRN